MRQRPPCLLQQPHFKTVTSEKRPLVNNDNNFGVPMVLLSIEYTNKVTVSKRDVETNN